MMTKKFTKAQQEALEAAKAALDRTPWQMTVKTGKAGTPTLEIINTEWDSPELYGRISYSTLRHCRDTIQTILSRVHDELGRPLGIQVLIDDRIAFRGTLPLSIEAGTKLALIAILAHGIKDPAHIELLARRIGRYTREEAGYWLGKVTIPIYGDGSLAWARTGLRIMLTGQPGDKEPIEAALDKLRGW